MNATRIRGSKTWKLKALIVRCWPGFKKFRKVLNSALGEVGDSVSEKVTPFVVLASARSGSTLLTERLNSQRPCLRSDGEVFNASMRGSATSAELIRQTYFTHTGHSVVGCKVLAEQVTDSELQELLSVERLRVVILERSNVVRQLVSHRIAQNDRKWTQSSVEGRSAPVERRVEVSAQELLEFRDQHNVWYERFRRMAANLPILEVRYEDLAEDIEGEVRRVADFLGAGEPKKATPPSIRRQNPEPLRDLISNFESLREQLADLGEIGLVADLDA